MVELYTKPEIDALLAPLQRRLLQLATAFCALKESQSEWVTQEEACRLAGRSRRWFTQRRMTDTLPIAMQPRTADNGRIFFLRADCVKYARENRILPPFSNPFVVLDEESKATDKAD